jgi:hypothetical protein
VADGDPVWSKGWRSYDEMYAHVWDRLRFGKGFTIDDRPQELRLIDVHDELLQIVKNQAAEKIHTVEAKLDGYRVKAERFEVEDLHGRDVTDHLRNALGTPYVLGGWGLGGMDCSGSTGWSHAFEGVTLPHKAEWQHDLFRNHEPGFHLIDATQLLEGDLVFLHNDDHVATFLTGTRTMASASSTRSRTTQGPLGMALDLARHGHAYPTGFGQLLLRVPVRERFGRIEKINGKP